MPAALLPIHPPPARLATFHTQGDEALHPAALLRSSSVAARRQRIVIVGGGAGGLELAARLGDSAGREGAAEIMLIDSAPTHLWKPLLHEVAAGTLNRQHNELDYLQQARRHHFRFHLGRLEALERGPKRIWLSPLTDEEGLEIAPRRPVAYDTLVIAVGAIDNDFGTPGVREHAISLNNVDQADRFHRRLLALCARADLGSGEPVHIAVIGGGATGVELAAELVGAGDDIASYGLQLQKLKRPLRLTLIEAGPRLLAALPGEIAARAQADLAARGVELRLGQQVAEVRRDAVLLRDGGHIAADLVVWAAGVRGPQVLAALGGLETNPQQQLMVRPTLQTTVDDDVFAFGDCACCRPVPEAPPVPPKAQAAHQQARLLARSLCARLAGEPVLPFTYRERGTLLTLGRDRAVGSMDTPSGRKLVFGGLPARLSYWVLYRRHLAILLGTARMLAVTFGQWLTRRAQPRVKLH